MDTKLDNLTKRLSEDLKAFSQDPKNMKDGYTYEKEFSKIMKSYEGQLLEATMEAPGKDRNKKNDIDHIW